MLERAYDVVVIGGGVAGACIAWDAALRGLSVVLLERGDFGGATSAHSLKIVHGGIRYLQHLDLLRLRESSRERSTFVRIAPHLVYPLPFVVPAYGHGLRGKGAFLIALGALSALTLDRNWQIKDPSRRLPIGHIISRDECLQLFPDLERNGLTGAGVFYDCQIYNPSRLVFSIIRSAIDAGAAVLNYCDVRKLIMFGNRVRGVGAVDRLSGDHLEVYGKVVVNAVGPYAEELLVRSGVLRKRHISLSRDMAVVVSRCLSDHSALAVQTKYKDPDAFISRGNRHIFLVPWRHYTLIGVNSKAYVESPDELRVTEEEVQSFIDEINAAYPALRLELNDVSVVNVGLLPFGDNDPKRTHLSFGKRSHLIDHARDGGPEGLISVMSVRFTTGRAVAEKAVDLACQKLSLSLAKCRTQATPVYGGQIERFDCFLEEAIKNKPPSLDASVVSHLVRNYGASYSAISAMVRSTPHLAETVGQSTTTKAEVIHAVRFEMAQRLSDVVLRRTDLGTGEYPGDTALRTCAELMRSELDWSEYRAQQEIEEVKGLYPVWTTAGTPKANVPTRHRT